jgi:mono/diheme cytochrome c family protein
LEIFPYFTLPHFFFNLNLPLKREGQRPDLLRQRDETGRYPAPPHDETGHTWHHDNDLIADIIKHGGMGNLEMFYPMPAFGDQLSDRDIESVLYYIKGMWTAEQRTSQQEITEVIRQQNNAD